MPTPKRALPYLRAAISVMSSTRGSSAGEPVLSPYTPSALTGALWPVAYADALLAESVISES